MDNTELNNKIEQIRGILQDQVIDFALLQTKLDEVLANYYDVFIELRKIGISVTWFDIVRAGTFETGNSIAKIYMSLKVTRGDIEFSVKLYSQSFEIADKL